MKKKKFQEEFANIMNIDFIKLHNKFESQEEREISFQHPIGTY